LLAKDTVRQFLARCEDSVLKGEKQLAAELATQSLERGYDILDIVDNGFAVGIRRAGDLWEAGEYFLPELAFSAEAMKSAMTVLQPALIRADARSVSKGVVIIGTVQGDIHDIGKTLVATMLSANGYQVIDLGSDVPHTRFLEEASRHDHCFLCMSALLTTTMANQAQVIGLLEQQRLRDKVRVIVGGAPTSEPWAKDIGADRYAANAVEAVQVIDSLI